MKDFVPYELAVKLKEKGFREKCRESYREGELISNKTAFNCDVITDIKMSYNTLNDKINTQGLYTDIIDAPTISQVLKWLRDKHAIHITIGMYSFGWYYNVVEYEHYEEDGRYDLKPAIQSFTHNGSYEQAALAGISWTLDNLI